MNGDVSWESTFCNENKRNKLFKAQEKVENNKNTLNINPLTEGCLLMGCGSTLK